VRPRRSAGRSARSAGWSRVTRPPRRRSGTDLRPSRASAVDVDRHHAAHRRCWTDVYEGCRWRARRQLRSIGGWPNASVLAYDTLRAEQADGRSGGRRPSPPRHPRHPNVHPLVLRQELVAVVSSRRTVVGARRPRGCGTIQLGRRQNPACHEAERSHGGGQEGCRLHAWGMVLHVMDAYGRADPRGFSLLKLASSSSGDRRDGA
jgi:hypothetical protein